MERLKTLLFPLIFITIIAVSYFVYQTVTANNMDKLISEEKPFGIFLVLKDSESGRIEHMAQMVIYPRDRHVLYYFINTDAAYEEQEGAISSLSPSSADRFENYTEVKSYYHIYSDTNSLARWIDLAGGFPYFLEEPFILENSEYQYPQGFHKFTGRQFVEFLRARKKTDSGKEYMSGVERLYRAQSMLLTMVWNRQKISESISQSELRNLAFSFFETSMNADEMGSLAAFLADTKEVNSSVMEVPLELLEKGTPYNPVHVLLVKDKRGKGIYRQFQEDLESGKFRSDTFSVEVLNGTEINGLARKMQQYVQDRGPLVLDTNNYIYKPNDITVIVDRSGNVFNAEKMSELLEIKPEYVFFRRQNLEVDVTLILGNDVDRKKFHI